MPLTLTGMLDIQTPVPTLTWQTLYPMSYLLNPVLPCFKSAHNKLSMLFEPRLWTYKRRTMEMDHFLSKKTCVTFGMPVT